MNIVHLHPGPDTGGQSVAGKRYLEEAGHSVRVFAQAPHVHRYPAAEGWDMAVIEPIVEQADVVVVHNDARVLAGWSAWRGKRIVLHHHGSHFRGNPDVVFGRGHAVGARQVVSTVDLLLCAPDGVLEWFPQVIDVERMRSIRDMRSEVWKPRTRPLVTHAPTNRGIKGTRYVEKASILLRHEVDFLIITHKPWETCLAMKASSDLFVDQLHLGYGNNAIEAWAMGLPVMSGASPEIVAEMRRVFGSLPFYLTTSGMLAEDVAMMVREPVVSEAWAAEGMRHVQRFHAPDAWTRQALSVYGPPLAAVA